MVIVVVMMVEAMAVVMYFRQEQSVGGGIRIPVCNAFRGVKAKVLLDML